MLCEKCKVELISNKVGDCVELVCPKCGEKTYATNPDVFLKYDLIMKKNGIIAIDVLVYLHKIARIGLKDVQTICCNGGTLISDVSNEEMSKIEKRLKENSINYYWVEK